MGAHEISDLLDRASEAVPPPAFAEVAWSRAYHVRRRRRSVVAVVAVVAALAVTGGALHSLRPAPTVGGASDGPGTRVVDRIPAVPGVRAVRQLPATGLTPPRDARNLTSRPVRRAVAVYQQATVDGDTFPQPLYVLDTDGTWARVDSVGPTFTRDADGNRADPLRPTAISPDRLRIVVAQPDEVIVVDMTVAGVHSVPLPGLNEQVVWLSDDVVLVTQDLPGGAGPASFAVNWRTGTVTPVGDGPTAWDVAGPARPDGSVVELGGRPGPEPVSVAEWDLTTRRVRGAPVDAPPGYTITEWSGPGFRNGDLVVRAGFAGTPTGDAADVVAVVDARTGAVRRLLEPDRGRVKGCCQPLDWVDPVTVLLRTDREGLLTWNVRTGEVSSVAAGRLDGTLAVALD